MFTFTLSCFSCALNYLSKVFCHCWCLWLHVIPSPQCRLRWVISQLFVLCAQLFTPVQLCSISCWYPRKSVWPELSAGVVFTLTPVIFIMGCVVRCRFLNTSHTLMTFTSTGRPKPHRAGARMEEIAVGDWLTKSLNYLNFTTGPDWLCLW